MITHLVLRNIFSEFWRDRGHHEIPPIPLVPKDDPTTLFTGSGMQQLVPYLLGEPHPLGQKLYNIQPCFRSQDIDEIGDNRHTTFFEMMGNWSLGTYFKKEQLAWLMEFLVEKLQLPVEKLSVTVFKGEGNLPPDNESIKIWQSVFAKYNIKAHPGERIFVYGSEKNWWSRAGSPKNMPVGEPGGPDSEVFYDFGPQLKLHENSPYKDQHCHVNCDCGRYLEICNSVFMQYQKVSDGTFQDLPKKNVDFGGGLERLLMAAQNSPDVFKIDVLGPIIKEVEKISGQTYEQFPSQMRVVADHLKGAIFMITQGVLPSNKDRGYILRRLLRRSALKLHQLNVDIQKISSFEPVVKIIIQLYENIYTKKEDIELVEPIIKDELQRFGRSITKGLLEFKKITRFTGKVAFDFYQNYGFPLELFEELLKEQGKTINREEFRQEFEHHKQLSRTASAGKFKGGLADHSVQVLKYHTATHLLHQALFDVLGQDIRQEGSNITAERLRFDFSSSRKPTAEDIAQVQQNINEKIKEKLAVSFIIIPKEEAYRIGAKSFFREKYPEKVKVYYIGGSAGSPQTAYSKEFCGGPHVKNTGEIGKIEIYKTEKIGSNLYRVYAR